jgi:hypothetical protein
MDFSLPHNTKALQERHKDVYEKFFSENDLVISNDMYVFLFPGVSWRAGSPQADLKLPFRMYLGVQKVKKTRALLRGGTTVYKPEIDKFVDESETYLDWEVTEEYLSELIEEISGKKEHQGLRFNCLIEEPGNRGFEFGVTALLTVACRLIFDPSSHQIMNRIPKIETLKRSDEEAYQLFEKLIANTTNLSSRSYHGVVSGRSLYSALLDGKSPFIGFSEECAGTIEKRLFDLPPLDVRGDYVQTEHVKRWGFRLSELIGKGDSSFPLDVTSIYPGCHREYRIASEYVENSVVPGFDKLRDEIKELFEGHIDLETKHLPSFLNKIDVDGLYWQRYARGQVYARLQGLIKLVNLFKHRVSSVAANDFMETIDSLKYINAPFEELPSSDVQELARALRRKSREKGEKIAIRSYGWGKQGANILVFSRNQRFRQEIVKIVEELKEAGNPRINIDYASWRDGWGFEGLKVHQHISQGVYSELVKVGSKELCSWSADHKLTRGIVEKAEPKDFDLFLDATKGKLFIGGMAVTSKEIPSQKASLQILSALMEQVGSCVGNEELPGKTYSGYRNELQGKIIGPLEKVLQEKFEKSSGLSITGKLTDFKVCWDPKEITIGLLREI